MIEFTMRIFGYYTLYFLIQRFRRSLSRNFKLEEERFEHVVASMLLYVPCLTFVIYQLVSLGMRL